MTARLRECCKRLKLGNLDECYEQVEFQDRRQYLTELLELALIQRQNRRAQFLTRKAGFPTVKTLAGYDFGPVTFPQGLDRQALVDLAFLERKESVLMVGAVGTGKTHLAVALGVKACSLGKQVRFHRAADLCNALTERHQAGTAGKLIDAIARADLFILDELPFVSI